MEVTFFFFWQYCKCKCDGKPGQLKPFLVIHPSKCVWAGQPGTGRIADSHLYDSLYTFCGVKGEGDNGQGGKKSRRKNVRVALASAETSMPADPSVPDRDVRAVVRHRVDTVLERWR